MSQTTFKNAVILKETEKAFLMTIVHEAPNENFWINSWLPKSQLTVTDIIDLKNNDLCPSAKSCTVTMPVWLAQKNTTMYLNSKAHYNK